MSYDTLIINLSKFFEARFKFI